MPPTPMTHSLSWRLPSWRTSEPSRAPTVTDSFAQATASILPLGPPQPRLVQSVSPCLAPIGSQPPPPFPLGSLPLPPRPYQRVPAVVLPMVRHLAGWARPSAANQTTGWPAQPLPPPPHPASGPPPTACTQGWGGPRPVQPRWASRNLLHPHGCAPAPPATHRPAPPSPPVRERWGAPTACAVAGTRQNGVSPEAAGVRRALPRMHPTVARVVVSAPFSEARAL